MNDIQRLAGRVNTLADRLRHGDEPPAPIGRRRPSAGSDERLQTLASTIRDIESRTAALAAAIEPEIMPSPPKLKPPRRSVGTSQDGLPEFELPLRELRQRLDALRPLPSRPAGLSAEAAENGTSREATERRLRDAIAEISARQEAIDRAEPRPARTREEPIVDGERIHQEISRLGDALASIARREEEDSHTLQRLEQRLDALSRQRPASENLLNALRDDLGRIEGALGDTAREATLSSVEAGYAHIVERLDRLARERSEAEATLVSLPRELGRLAARMEDLGSSLPERDRLNDLATGVAQLGRAVAARGGGIDVSGLETRLAALANSVDALQRLIEEGKADQGFHQTDRMEEFVRRMEAVANRLEPGLANSAPVGIEGIRDEIGALRQAVMGAGRPQTEALESQLRALITRLEVLSDDSSLGQLETQVARLADRLDLLGPQPAALDKVEKNLGRLESLLQSNQRESLSAARDAARYAFAELSGAGQAADNNAVRSLRDELRRLQSAAENADQRTQDTLDTVQSALQRVVDRLATLEGPIASATERAESGEAPTEHPARQPAQRESRWTGIFGAPSEAAPTPPPAERGERQADRKADFIAAARRAAQAAAAESAALKPEVEAERSSGPLGRIGQALRSRRRPLLLAAAAVILTLAAVRFFGEAELGNTASAEDALNPAATTVVVANPANGAQDADTSRTALATTAPQAAPASASQSPPGGAPAETVAFAAPSQVDGRFGDKANAPPAASFAPLDTVNQPGSIGSASNSSAPAAPIPEVTIGPAALRAAAAGGDPNALYEVASRYAEGREVPQNSKLAAQWYQQASDRGLILATFRLATYYERGDGVAKDRQMARTLYAKAADQGNIRAMHNLAVMISEGVGTGPDYGEAADWFQRAADHGVKDSQYNLGVIFARGLGRKQDLIQSYKWFALAAAQGDSDASGRRDEVAKALGADQLAQARAAVQAWRLTPPLDGANAEPTPDPAWRAAVADQSAGLDRQGLVKKVQSLLAEQGFDPGPPDGVIGTKTKVAVRAFQSRAGLNPSGEIDAALLTALTRKTG